MGIKNSEFHADFKCVENVSKKCTQKNVSAKQIATNMSRSEKSVYFRHFLRMEFFSTFSKDLKLA